MPCEFVALIVAFAPLFSKPVFQHVQVLLLGAILSPGKRTVTQALRVMGKNQDPHFQNYHRVLNRSIKIWQRTTPIKVWVNASPTGSLRACSPQDKCKLP